MVKKKINVKTGGMKKYPDFQESIRSGKEPANIKVTNMVETFLNQDRDYLRKIKAKTTKMEPEKVYTTVTTFLKEDSSGLKKIRVITTKAEPKKVYTTVTTFLKEDSNGVWIISLNKCFNEILKQFQPMNLSKMNHYQQNKEYSEYTYFSI